MAKKQGPLRRLAVRALSALAATTEWKFGLGDEVKSNLTGQQGIVAARIEWLDGCRRYLIQMPKKRDGSLGDERTEDEGLITLVKRAAVVPTTLKPREAPPAGPQSGDRAATRRDHGTSTRR